MESREVSRAVLKIKSAVEEGGSVQVDILRGGRVRLRLRSRDSDRDLFCETLEDGVLLAAAEPALGAELYEQLVWELEMMGLRGV